MGRISPGPTRWPPGAEKRLVPAKPNLKPQTSNLKKSPELPTKASQPQIYAMIHEVARKKDDLSTLDPRQDPQAATRAGEMMTPNEAKAGPNNPKKASRVDGDLGPLNLGSTPSYHARRQDDGAQRSKGRSKRPKRSVARRRRPRTFQPWIHAKIHKVPHAQARGRSPTKQRQVQTTQTKRRAPASTAANAILVKRPRSSDGRPK